MKMPTESSPTPRNHNNNHENIWRKNIQYCSDLSLKDESINSTREQTASKVNKSRNIKSDLRASTIVNLELTKPHSVFGMRNRSLLVSTNLNASPKIKTPVLGAERLRKTFYQTALYDSQKNNNNEKLLPNIATKTPATNSYE